MSLPPKTTPIPQPVFMPGMSHRTEEPAPTSSVLPFRPKSENTGDQKNEGEDEQERDAPYDPPVNLPHLSLQIRDLAHEGAGIFLTSINAPDVLRTAIEAIHKHLYSGIFTASPATATTTSSSSSSSSAESNTNTSPYPTHPHPPPTRVVTLILRSMDGVAYTTGSDQDDAHKEIHFSLRYIAGIQPTSRRAAEITGVVTHELVHCYQWNGLGSAPGGLIEGVADWVRLQAGLAPPHWRRDQTPSRWDAGYQSTAYFLEYLEGQYGKGTVRRLNERLRKEKYVEDTFWAGLFGKSVAQLFEEYKKTLPEKETKR
ncbi:hypothetical protein M426DRAFT_56796 [Hypoxylon sp. CI-4A]|nr:hypothetical protein M426DRAFT_56796 [Hypoxylon sp. CI-4A]